MLASLDDVDRNWAAFQQQLFSLYVYGGASTFFCKPITICEQIKSWLEITKKRIGELAPVKASFVS